jgi:membrane protease YdiL (CAAX protease family)
MVAVPASRGPREPRDAGSKRTLIIASVMAAVLWVLIVGLQRLPEGEEVAPPAPVAGEAVPPAPGNAQLDLTAKMLLKILLDVGMSDPSAPQQLAGYARLPEDFARVAIVAAEMQGAAEAQTWLKRASEALEKEPSGSMTPAERAARVAVMEQDLRVLGALYADPQVAPDAADREHLTRRYGWLGEVAGTFKQEDLKAEREALVAGGALAFGFLIAFFAGVGLALVAGVVMLVLVLVGVTSRKARVRFVPPERGGSVYMEVFALFLLAFLGVQVVSALISLTGVDRTTTLGITLGVQWLLVLVPLWPILRGVPWSEARRAMGLTTGQGVLREVGAGVFAYLATLPVLFVAFLIGFILLAAQQLLTKAITGEEPPAPSNVILELVADAPWWKLLLFASLAVVWAPLVEETVFRGALYRHMRGRLGMVFAAILTAVMFALVHGYPLALMAPLITLGVSFAFMREWRGSVISCITAHALHNGSIMLLLLSLIKLLA